MATRRRLAGGTAVTVAGLVVLGFTLARGSESAGPLPPGAASASRAGDLIAALQALGPHVSIGEESRLFDRLVGIWDCDYGFYAGDGSVRHASGELRFGWIIDGRALQDIWITYPKPGSKDERKIGIFQTTEQVLMDSIARGKTVWDN